MNPNPPLSMNLDSPVLLFFAGCLVWIPLAVWTVQVVHWMVMGEFDFLMGLLSLFAALLLGVITVHPPYPAMGPITFLFVVALVCIYPSLRSMADHHALRAIDGEQLDKLRHNVLVNPANFAAKFRMAEILHDRGLIAQAIAIAEDAVAAVPPSAIVREKSLIKSWTTRSKNAHISRPLECHNCGTSVPLNAINCPSCGEFYLRSYVTGFARADGSHRLVTTWAVLTIITMLVALSSKYLSPAVNAFVIPSALIGGGLLLFRTFKGGLNATA